MQTSILLPVIKFMLIATVAFGVSVILVTLQGKRARYRDGWHYLTPGPMMWTAVIGGALLTGFFCYIYFFVGSTRPDAEAQMNWLLGLLIAFDLMTMIVAYSIVADEVRWNGNRIERRTLLFSRRGMSWQELAAIGMEPATGFWWISSAGGPRIRFSPYCSGFQQLLPSDAVKAMESVLARA